MKKIYNISLCALLFLLLATSCNQSHTAQVEEESDIIAQIRAIGGGHHISPDSIHVLLNTIWVENAYRMTNREKFTFYNARGLAYLNAREFETAETNFRKALYHLEQLSDSNLRGKARVILNIGLVRRNLGELEKAINLYRQAALYGYGDLELMLVLYINTGALLITTGEIDSALYYKQSALNLATKKDNRGAKAMTLLNLSVIQRRLYQFPQAEENLQRAIPIFIELNNQAMLWRAYYNLAALILELRNRVEEGLRYVHKSNEIAAAMGLPQVAMAPYYLYRGQHYLETGYFRNSLAMFYQALELLIKIQDVSRTADIKSYIVAVYSRLGNFDTALAYANRVLKVAQENRILRVEANVHNHLAVIHAARGDVYGVWAAMEAERNLRKKLFDEQSSRALHEMQIRYETEINQLLIAQKAEEIHRQRITNLLLMLVFIVFTIALSLYILLQRRKMRDVLRIVQQYEALSEVGKDASHVSNKTEKAAKLSDEEEEVSQKLQHLFEVEKIYRQQGLNVHDVVKMLDTKRTHLTEVLTRVHQKSFNEFVNAYRVEEAVEMLREQNEGGKYAHLTIHAVAREVGFNGRTAFYDAFKAVIGVTPSEYKKALREIELGKVKE